MPFRFSETGSEQTLNRDAAQLGIRAARMNEAGQSVTRDAQSTAQEHLNQGGIAAGDAAQAIGGLGAIAQGRSNKDLTGALLRRTKGLSRILTANGNNIESQQLRDRIALGKLGMRKKKQAMGLQNVSALHEDEMQIADRMNKEALDKARADFAGSITGAIGGGIASGMYNPEMTKKKEEDAALKASTPVTRDMTSGQGQGLWGINGNPNYNMFQFDDLVAQQGQGGFA